MRPDTEKILNPVTLGDRITRSLHTLRTAPGRVAWHYYFVDGWKNPPDAVHRHRR